MSVESDNVRRPPQVAVPLGVRAVGSIPRPARPINGQTCGDCPPEARDRCLRERLCWIAEQEQIRAEREARAAERNGRGALEAMDAGQKRPPKLCAEPGCGKPARGEFCQEHGDARRREMNSRPFAGRQRKHTRESIIAAIQEHAAEHGLPPTGKQMTTIAFAATRTFGSWADAVEAAGFPRPKRGRKPGSPRPTPAAAAPEPDPEPEPDRGGQPEPVAEPPAEPVDVDAYEAMLDAADRLDQAGELYDQAVRDYRAALARLETS